MFAVHRSHREIEILESFQRDSIHKLQLWLLAQRKLMHCKNVVGIGRLDKSAVLTMTV